MTRSNDTSVSISKEGGQERSIIPAGSDVPESYEPGEDTMYNEIEEIGDNFDEFATEN